MRLPNFIPTAIGGIQKHPVLSTAMIMLGCGWLLLSYAQPGAQEVVRKDTSLQTNLSSLAPTHAATNAVVSQMQSQLQEVVLLLKASQAEKAVMQAELAKKTAETAALTKRQDTLEWDLDRKLQQALSAARQPTPLMVNATVPKPPVPVLRVLKPATPPTVYAQPQPDTVTLPQGSVASGLLLHGAFATTSQRNSGIPLTFRIEGAFRTPMGKVVYLKGCHMTGSAEPVTSAARLQAQLVAISCILPDQRVWQSSIKGYITGRDNVLGIPGRIETRNVEKLQQMVLAALAALPGDLATGTRQQVTAIGPLGAVTRGATSTLSEVSSRAANMFLDEAARFQSVLWVPPDQQSYLYLLESVEIPDWIVGQSKTVKAFD